MTFKTKSLIVLIAVPLMCFISTASAERVLVDCENYTDSHDLAYIAIHTLVAPSCHGGFMLVGVDFSDEWVEYDLTVSALGTWTVGAVCRGDAGIPYALRLSVTGDVSGTYQETMITYNGVGYGWSSWVNAYGLGSIGLYETSYKVRLTYVSGASTELDYIWFESAVPVRESTWGAVKMMYRD